MLSNPRLRGARAATTAKSSTRCAGCSASAATPPEVLPSRPPHPEPPVPPALPKHIKLTYFDFHGGRGEPIRLALSIAGIPFEDERITPANWAERKPHARFGGLPQIEVDGETISQSNAIGRYAGILAGLYP